MLVNAEENKDESDSSSSHPSSSSSQRGQSREKYTSTVLLEPAGQRLNEIIVNEETMSDIRASLESYVTSLQD